MDVMRAAAMRTGTMTSMTSDSFQPMKNPWMKARMKQANNSMALENFSPRPSTILCISLQTAHVNSKQVSSYIA